MAWRTTRRSQSVIPFGVGSIVEFEDEALMPAGLDVWPREAERIRDDRLARQLGVFDFRVPPPKPEWGVKGVAMGHLPYVRFPQWHFCPFCRFLKKVELFTSTRPRCDNPTRRPGARGSAAPCATRPEKRRPLMFPLRFVVACERGHVEDFPWNAWAHTDSGEEIRRDAGCTPPELYFYATKQGGLSGLVVECGKCGNKRSMLGVTGPTGLKGLTCSGQRPWLGPDAAEACSAKPGDSRPRLMALQRGASNLYFPESASSILIPPYSSKVRRVLETPNIWELLTSATEDGAIPVERIRTVALMRGLDEKEAIEAFTSLRDEKKETESTAQDETAFRFAEYSALQGSRRDANDALSCRPQDIGRYGALVRDYFDLVSRVERLTETRALTGLRRIGPSGEDPASLSRGNVRWLPAFQVRGEGIFLRVRADRLASVTADGRANRFLNRIVASERCRLAVSTEMIVLHTLAHLLIKRLSYEAGYGASSIRERIYTAPPAHDRRMGGLLLYTASGDADGTLGGLVELGRPGSLERIVAGAIEDARWCASDPICIESGGQGPESMNLAACHACSLLPETSCEMLNRYLDRGLLQQFFAT